MIFIGVGLSGGGFGHWSLLGVVIAAIVLFLWWYLIEWFKNKD